MALDCVRDGVAFVVCGAGGCYFKGPCALLRPSAMSFIIVIIIIVIVIIIIIIIIKFENSQIWDLIKKGAEAKARAGGKVKSFLFQWAVESKVSSRFDYYYYYHYHFYILFL